MYVLRDVGICRTDICKPIFDVVQKTLRHGRVLVQIHQVGSLLKNSESFYN